uniref:Dual specificity phosphatase 28 n=1 Tax=Pogona vitticeps TaxID=103695 RepID=A0A6J0UKX6_9SAUR
MVTEQGLPVAACQQRAEIDTALCFHSPKLSLGNAWRAPLAATALVLPPSSMLALCKVTDSLFISNSRSACNENLLAQEKISLCINVSRQQPFPSSQKIQTLRVPVFDDPSEDLHRYFESCSDAIEGTVQSGGKCLVYCKNGRSRSAALCIAYLMRYQNLSLKDAFEIVKMARPVIDPNPGFWSQLQKYEEHLKRKHLGDPSQKGTSQ